MIAKKIAQGLITQALMAQKNGPSIGDLGIFVEQAQAFSWPGHR
jgi:hypothetical protein